MDGYAVRTADAADTRTVVEEIPAGHVPRLPVGPGQASRIMTGAALPDGADAVVMVERTDALADGRVRLRELPARPGQNVLPRGRELRRGDTVLTAGTPLRPCEIGLLAAVGRAAVPVTRRPVVAVLATGDELVEPPEVPGPGCIRNSNAPMLLAQAATAGAEPRYLGIARDTLDSLRPLVAEGLTADVLILSGGVSAGQRDLVPAVLQDLGVRPVFHRIAMKPGKPLFFGTRDGALVFGLPGNPVSSLVGFELFVRPALRALLGHAAPGPAWRTARLTRDWAYQTDRPTYHPARLTLTADGWGVTTVPWFGSPDLRALGAADALARIAAGDHAFRAGDPLPVLPLFQE
jgi:molybdopterin molybdotransferase